MNINSEAAMIEFGQKIAQQLSLPSVIELVGDVGTGKTTFTRGLARGLGIAEAITSPSFTISKRYCFPIAHNSSSTGELVHYDFYRLSDPGIMRAELDETLRQPNSVVIIEWAGDVASLLPEKHLRLEFSLNSDDSRHVTINNQDLLQGIKP